MAVSQSDIIEQEETEQEETEEETEQEEVEPREVDQEASISEMLESQLESANEQLLKRRRMSRTLRSAQTSVTREDEAEATEQEEPKAPTPSRRFLVKT